MLALDTDAVASLVPRGTEPVDAVPRQIGPYTILRRLGEGGMGVVYLVEQQEPLRRSVALKLLKHNVNSSRVLARFRSEQQVLALMSHPGVAKVFDAGEAEDGRPYFVMEFVDGLPITAYCDQHQLPVRARLELFVQVCEAIHHAHQKGILHRDIKPSNVLVEEVNGKPAARVIDFGVAKAINRSLIEDTLFTEQGFLVGTLAYMSPEQTESTVLDADTRSDVYSLGVLLYELLVGALPIDSHMLRKVALAEILRSIREEEPPTPTTRIEGLGDTAIAVARQRHTTVRSLVRFLKGDLDWITMRALEKSPARRYASASEFALDLERHLAGEPVAAGPPGTAYRIRKLARKHRAVTTALLVVFASLALWITVVTALYFRAVEARELAQMEVDIEAALQQLDRRQFQAMSMKVIEGNRKALGQGPDFARLLSIHLLYHYVTTREFQGFGGFTAPDNFKPAEVRALEDEVMRILDRTLDSGDLSVLDIVLSLAELEVEDRAALEKLSAKAFNIALMQRSSVDPKVLGHLADVFESLIPQAIERAGERGAEQALRRLADFRRAAPASSRKYLPHTLDSLAQILARRGSSLRRQGRTSSAEPFLQEALTLSREVEAITRRKDNKASADQSVLDLESELGASLTEAGRFADAETLLLHAYEEFSGSRGHKSHFTQVALYRLVALYEGWGVPKKAATYRDRLSAVTIRDMWDLGSFGALSPLGQVFSVQWREMPAVVFTDSVGSRPSGGWGQLGKDSFQEGYVKIHESLGSQARKDFIPFMPAETAENTEHRRMNCQRDKRSDCHTRWFLWPHSLVPDRAHKRALVFYSKWKRDGANEDFPVRVGTSLAVWRSVDLPAERLMLRPEGDEPTLLFSDDEPAWGNVALVADDYLYAYVGFQEWQLPSASDGLLARAPLTQALVRSAWRFYAGPGRWSDNARDARPLPGLKGEAPISVHWNEYLGKYLLAAAVPRQYYKVRWRTADRPEGPWSEPLLDLQGRGRIGPIHPTMAIDGGRVEFFTYQRTGPYLVKRFDFGGTTGTPDETHLFAIEFSR